ncbi:MAG: hypothetical protein PHD01_18150, partial [Geobacteraceae bacterium]|nr:hypothetical protein [Geobacteraceae bacterium]
PVIGLFPILLPLLLRKFLSVHRFVPSGTSLVDYSLATVTPDVSDSELTARDTMRNQSIAL